MRHLATIEIIQDMQPIENADFIEKARVREWWVVIKKGTFKVGDKCTYYEIDSFLPLKPEYEFLLKGGSIKRMLMDGGEEIEGIRLRTVKLRGQISQGLILPVPDFLLDKEIGYDCSEDLGVFKYEPPIPAHLKGEIKGSFPFFIPKTDEERIQNCAEILELCGDARFYATEKLNGTSVTYYKKDGVFGVCGRKWELKETEDNTYWQIARKLNIEVILPDNCAIQGEIIGEGIQKNMYRIKGHKVFFFNVYDITKHKYLDFYTMKDFIQGLGLVFVPIHCDSVIFNIKDTVANLIEHANNLYSVLIHNVAVEGLVYRSQLEGKVELKNGSIMRKSFKVISNNHLLEEEDL